METRRKGILIIFLLVIICSNSNACWMEGVNNWGIPEGNTILDTFRGNIFDRATRDIESIIGVSFWEGLNSGPYVTVNLNDSRFMITTNDAFVYYEEYETLNSMSVTVNFRCTGGSTASLIFFIEVEDTNNNPPRFLPSNQLEYTIFTPLPPGSIITGCFDGITVRDIDLTTERIDFAIEDNPYFEIVYDADASTTPKEFIGVLKTTTFIRSLPEPFTFTISATDVDRTNDPPLTTNATVTVRADTDFQLPEEPVFAQTFYFADYNNENQISLIEPISLQSGFDDLVQFRLEGEFVENFRLIAEGNRVILSVVTPLAGEFLREKQIFLAVKAEREHTSGASATIIIRLPEEIPLEFERAYYEGTIENNILQSPFRLTLIRGYAEQDISVNIISEYTTYFTTNIQDNIITILMQPLSDIIIKENNMLFLEIVASTEFSRARTIATLKIIKDDTVTPVFNRPIYEGSYNTDMGLTLEEIVFDQGYDDTVELSLEGEHASLFRINPKGSIVTLTTTAIPPEIFSQKHILLTLQATKPRTVGATTAIVISLPTARQLHFEDSTYRGTLQDNILSLGPIILSSGYDESVTFNLLGEHVNYFTLTSDRNQIIVRLGGTIPDYVIRENNLIILTVEASDLNAITTTTSVLVDIIKDDITTPVFSRNIYYGTYQDTTSVNIENINLSQGFGDDVKFALRGDHAQYFEISNKGNSVTVALRSSIPEEVIYNEKVLLFNIIASKPLTVGANAAISISFPLELTELVIMRFTQNTYNATIENSNLRADNIVLSTGYQSGTEFILTGDNFLSYFNITNIENVASLSLVNPLPVEDIESTFIILEIEARRKRAASVWTSVVIEMVKAEIQPLAFSSLHYQGVYNQEQGTLSIEEISLADGYDETVNFELEGDIASMFSIFETSSNVLTIVPVEPIPNDILENYNLVIFSISATKPNAHDAHATISIYIEREQTVHSVLGFDSVTYVGSIQGTLIILPPITLIEGYTEQVTFSLNGDLASYFTISSQGAGVVSVTLPVAIPDQMIPSNRLIVLDIRAGAPQALPAHAAIVLEVILDDDVPSVLQLVFGATYYTGSYTALAGVVLDTPISLTQGYDDAVEFVLEGDHAQWFDVVRNDNSVSLRVSSSIPSDVLANHHQLVFVIRAQRLGSGTARATIVISLADEKTENPGLSFDRVTYIGSIQDTLIILPPITLIEGYTDQVTFSLNGDLASYFTISSQGAGVVSVTLPVAIPDQMIPSNRLIVLDIRAGAPQALPAHAAIVLEVILDDDVPSVLQLVFGATYYTGSYTALAGVVLDTPISLTQGYDDAVEFVLEGDHAQWFDVVRNDNSVSLRVSSSIPSDVLANHHQLVFVIRAQRLGSGTARATIVISLADEKTENPGLSFDRVTYIGSIQDTLIILPPITLIEGYTDQVTFSLNGDLASYFTISSQGAGVVSVTLPVAIPDQMIPSNRLIVLDIRAGAPQALPAHAAIVLEVILDDDVPSVLQLVFGATYYTGSYTALAGVVLDTPISLTQGYDDAVEFVLEGDHAQWFDVVRNDNSVSLRVSSSIPSDVLANHHQLVFVIRAQRLGSGTARATIVISLADEKTENPGLGFDRVTYIGSIQDTLIILPPITLIEGYTDQVSFSLNGDLASYFTISSQGAGVVSVTLPVAIPDQMIPSNRLIVLDIRAGAPQVLPAHAAIVLEVILDDDVPSVPQLVFDATYYTGSYTALASVMLDTPISLTQGYDDAVEFVLEGDHAQWFDVVRNDNSVSLRVSSSIPSDVLANNHQLVFVIRAQRLGSGTARATIVISLADEKTENPGLGFDRVTYIGSIQDTLIILPPITLIEGYTDQVTFSLNGDLASYFTISSQGAGVVSVTLPVAIPDQMIPSNRLIVLDIRAGAPQVLPAHAAIVLEVILEDDVPSMPQLVFGATYYTGSYTALAGVVLDTPISLTQGYDDAVEFVLEGDHAQWFDVVGNDNSVSLKISSSIPSDVLANNHQFVFVIKAQRLGSGTARATIVISLADDSQAGEDVSFDKLIYDGIIQLGIVQHESITVENYDGVDVDIHGEYSSLFVVRMTDGVVAVQAFGSLNLPDDVTQVVLELHASDARAVLLLNVIYSDVPSLPLVTFSSPSYVLNVEIVQTGPVGRVQATADNGERISYSLYVNNAHLQTRISINNEGELYLSAPANSGVYTFQVIATTVITRAEGTAEVYLTVEAVTICGDDEIVVPPLIILNRDEEEPHNNLVILNTDQFEGCHFTIGNRWPHEQDWLYVDENGLHARSIDRENASIAFMTLSQVQVELTLHCENDNAVCSKRSLRTNWLHDYDYGTSTWILTESISYNARKSLVNLIVNDINDNYPIFIAKEFEPIVVGYPIKEIEERILPRSLAELQATDADIGENAALKYWSSEDVLAVAPTTGFVHLRTGAQLENNQRLTVSATDQNGQGLTGEINLMVKLLDLNNIVVITVKDAFLDDEKQILAQVSEAVGYEVKVLRSVIISDDLIQDEDALRNYRNASVPQTSLLLYVYGFLQKEPVPIERLTTDISNNAVTLNIVSTIPLEEHLKLEILPKFDIGFMIATIVLSIFLFIIIVVTAIWFFLKWRKNKNYEEFTQENNLASSGDSEEQLPKFNPPEPRLNIEQLRRSEQRLQDMLSTPIQEVSTEASPRREVPLESIIDLSPPELNTPIVIQSIDKLKNADDTDEDEFGETSKTKRKSVVTFNENVEKIIHLEDNDDEDTASLGANYEVFKF